MPEVNQLFFTHKEVLELLIKKAKIHEGKWMLSTNFGFAAGNFGPGPDQLSPGAIVTVIGIGLQKAASETPEAATLDASVINPGPTKPMKRRKMP
jgi:hypothetical protein